MADGDRQSILTDKISSNPNSAFLIRLAKGDSLITGISVFNTLLSQQNRGIYISCNANSPYAFLQNYFSAHGIDTSKMLFIDSVSAPLLERALPEAENVFFTQKTVTRDSMAIMSELLSINSDISFVYFDSLTELLKYHDEQEITRFLLELVTLIKKHQVSGFVLSYYGAQEENIVREITRYFDHRLEL